MLKIQCQCCQKELSEQGALLFLAPDYEGFCEKVHLCNNCALLAFEYVQQQPTTQDQGE